MRNVSIVVVCLLMGFEVTCGLASEPHSAAELARVCAFAKNLKSRAELNKSTVPGSGSCVGYFINARTFFEPGTKHSVADVCLPRGISIIRMIHIYLGYFEAHPEVGEKPYLDVVTDAMMEPFPCKS